MKICPEHGVIFIRFSYCHVCGKKLWEITEDEFTKAYDFMDKKSGMATKWGNNEWIKWLKSRHPEFK